MPRTKNVAFAPSSSSSSKIAAVCRSSAWPAGIPVRVVQAAVHELVPVLEVEAEQELGHRLNSKIEALEEVRSHADRRRAARCDGDRLRGHGAAQARGQPRAGDADHRALLAEVARERRGDHPLPAPARGGHPARRRRRPGDGRAPCSRNRRLRCGLPPVRVGRPERRGADRPGRRLPRSAAAEGRGPNDRVSEHGPGRLDAADDREGRDPATVSSLRTATTGPTTSTSVTRSASRPTRSCT